MREQDRSSTPARAGLREVSVRYGDTAALHGASLDLAAGSFTALLGPSGSGKSTALALLAGLRAPDTGDVVLDGRSVLGVPPERRPVGLVFQKPLLFPHLTVAQNVAFGLRMNGMGRRPARLEAEAALERVQLGGTGGRRPYELSGGQEQRVALARALVRRPRLLLLDEPFSQLDPDLRADVRRLVRELHDQAGVTTAFVTHDRDEAVELADRLVLVREGRLTDLGTPREACTRPVSLTAARAVGAQNEVAGSVVHGVFTAGPLRLPTAAADGPGVLVLRPEAVEVRSGAQSAGDDDPSKQTAGLVAARVKDLRFAGGHVTVVLALPDGQSLTAHVRTGEEPRPGQAVEVVLRADRCTVLPPEPPS